MSTFPVSLDALVTINPTDDEAVVSHSGRHTLEGDAINALQTKVGIDGSEDPTSLDYKVAAATVRSGTVEIDFGSFPGSQEASVTVTGQTGIMAASIIGARLAYQATDDHTTNDHAYAAAMIGITPGSIVADTSFVLYVRCFDKLQGAFNLTWFWSN